LISGNIRFCSSIKEYQCKTQLFPNYQFTPKFFLNHMKKSLSLLGLAIALNIFTACNNAPATTGTEKIKVSLETNRGAKVALNAEMVVLTLDALEAKKQAEKVADAEQVKALFQGLQSAQKVAKQMDAQLTLEDGPVEDGILVFGLNLPEAKTIKMELIDEEGFSNVGSNALAMQSQNNYQAINVNDIPNGSYIMRLTDDEGGEITRSFKVAKK
jgi:hypothetical protein